MNPFLEDILQGLSQHPKRLSSRYFYDAIGDGIFQEIMAMPSYYLPECEREIIRTKTMAIAQCIAKNNPLEIVELGAGDGSKTVSFLTQMHTERELSAYFPLDISANILNENVENVHKMLPNLPVFPVAGNYFETFPPKRTDNTTNRLHLFLGSNIGNFTSAQVHDFFKWMKRHMHAGDALLVAFDLKKNPETIIAAYNDASGITARFNLNLLHRMNRELGADFNTTAFVHHPIYDPETGLAKSFIMSVKAQTVTFKTGASFHFEPYETIHTEISKKFSLSEIESYATSHDLQCQHFFDERALYSLSLFSFA